MILVVVLKLSTEVIWFYLEYVPHIYYLKCNVYVAKKHVIHHDINNALICCEYQSFPPGIWIHIKVPCLSVGFLEKFLQASLTLAHAR